MDRSVKIFKKLNIWQIALLIVTFALGMAMNLFVPLPGDVGVAPFWTSWGAWILRLHMALGLAILILAIILFIKSRPFGDAVRKSSLLGLISVSIAFVAGVIFFFFGENDIFSYIMAIGFLGALISYLIITGFATK